VARWHEELSGRNVIFHLNSAAGDVLTGHAPGKVVTTAFLRSLTSAQLDLFIKVSMLADNNGPARLAQKNPAAAEQFALACILAGYGVSIRPASMNGRYGYRMTNVRMLSKRHIYPQESKRERSAFRIRRVIHDGRVWCPRTPNQTWLARRNGTVYFTGNSPVPDPSASFRGMSWLTPVLREVGADQALTQYKIAHVSRGAMPGMVLKYSQKLSEPTVEKLKKRFAALFAGPENAGKTLVLDEGADVTVAGSTLEQLQFTAVQAAGETRIAAASSVPVEIIGIEGPRSASGNYELAIRRFADLWARPHWRMACACLQHLLPSVPAASRLWYDVAGIAALREGELARGQALLVRTQAIAALVTAGYSRDSAIAAVESGDLSQLQADPAAAPPGAPTGTRPPQAGVPQDLPGAVQPNLPASKPFVTPPMPGMPNGARG